jgi:hypothetical protein
VVLVDDSSVLCSSTNSNMCNLDPVEPPSNICNRKKREKKPSDEKPLFGGFCESFYSEETPCLIVCSRLQGLLFITTYNFERRRRRGGNRRRRLILASILGCGFLCFGCCQSRCCRPQ